MLGFSYSAVGATAATPPDGFNVDRTRVDLGPGERVFCAGQDALRAWRQFPSPWIEVTPRPPIETGHMVAVLALAGGLWWMNACRIVYVVNESGPVCRFGFAYGTLPGHAEMGEERFTVEWDQESDRVSYSILAFSRPRHPLARLGYVWARRAQRRFARDSASAMRHAVANATETQRTA